MKFLITLLITLSSLFSFSQLSDISKAIKENLPEEYEKIKCFAIDNWEDDNSMVVHTINRQCEAMYEIFITEKYKEMLDDEYIIESITRWYHPECDAMDWSMVLYEIKKQIKNKDY